MNTAKITNVLVALISILIINAKADVIYADGQSHTIGTYIGDNVTVTGYIRIDEPLRSTAVDVINGGDIEGNVTVGSLGVLNLEGGSIQGNVIASGDSGSINIASGTVLGSVDVAGISTLYISSAHIGGNIYFGKSTDYFSITDSIIDGDVITAAVNYSGAAISNTTINGVLKSAVSPGMSISNCLLQSGIQASNFSVFSIYDSGIQGNIIADAYATVHVRGENFQLNGVDFTFDKYTRLSDFGSGHITGLTPGGQLIDFDFSISDSAEIFLVIPEPATLALLGFGGFWLAKRRR